MRPRGCPGTDAEVSPETYGGDTSCLEVRLDSGHRLVFDAGTGFRRLAPTQADEVLPVFLTHLHIDHIAGLSLCLPFWKGELRVLCYAPQQPQQSVCEVLGTLYGPPLWPVSLRELLPPTSCYEIPPEICDLPCPVLPEDVRVRACPLPHTGPAVAYRVDAGSCSLVYAPDHEVTTNSEGFLQFADGATCLVHDSQYRPGELDARRGWGHSSFVQAVEVALRIRARELLLWHHDPDRTDSELDEIGELAREECRVRGAGRLRVRVAYDGMYLEL